LPEANCGRSAPDGHSPARKIEILDPADNETNSALTLREAKYPAVHYIPRADVDMTRLARTAHTTYCPFKGDCSYFSLPDAGERGVNAVWTYEAPFPAVEAIKDHLAFYPNRVEIKEDR
jgi:uncharacterized protein (DUF427 family)